MFGTVQWCTVSRSVQFGANDSAKALHAGPHPLPKMVQMSSMTIERPAPFRYT